MKRLAVVLAAAVFGTGCIVTTEDPGYGSVNLTWDFLRYAPAQIGSYVTYDASLSGADGICPESGVDTVTVDAPGVAQINVSCIYWGVQGVVIDGLVAGLNSIRVRGWDGATVMYDSYFNVDVPANATVDYIADVTAPYASIDLFAYLYSDGTSQYYASCAAAGYPTIDYYVNDSRGTLILSDSAACSPDPTNGFAVYANVLDFDTYTVRLQGYNSTTRNFDSCTAAGSKWSAFDHFSTQTGVYGVPVILYYPPRCTN